MKTYFSWRVLIDYLVGVVIPTIAYALTKANWVVFVWPSGGARADAMFALFSASGSMLGFVLAASTFLIGHVQNERFTLLRGSKGWNQFPALIRSCIWRLMALTVFSYSISLVDDHLFRPACYVLMGVVTVTLIGISALLWVVTSIMAIK